MPNLKVSQNFIIVGSDVISISCSIAMAYLLRLWIGDIFNIIPLTHGISVYFEKWWFPAAIVVVMAYYGSYGIVVTVWDELLGLFRSLFISFLIVWVLLSLQKESESVSRLVITTSFLFLLILLPLSRLATKFTLFKVMDWRRPAHLFERRKGERRYVLRDTLNKEWYSGYKVVTNIDKDSLVEPIDTCFVPIEYTDEFTMRALKPNIRNMIVVSVQSGLSFMNSEIKTFLSRNMAFITTRNGLLIKRNLILKRVFDLVVSLVGLVVLSPLFLLVPLLVKIDSRGPALFRHQRCGMSLSSFHMIKYRTMVTNGNSVLAEFLATNPTASLEFKEKNKLSDDPRVTRIGKVLRKTSIDELPQLLNVIKGEMSIVGPRPDTKSALSDFLKEYGPIYERVRPGITGLWQVSGRSEIKYRERVKLDYMYVLNWSLWLDFVILLKTIKVTIAGKGAC